jgi:hypothetical protein
MISLEKKVAVYVNDSQRAEHVASLLARTFGGSTILVGFGYWVSADGETQIENLYYVFSFYHQVKKADLKEILEKVASWLSDQEAIAFEYNGKLFLASPKEALKIVE